MHHLQLLSSFLLLVANLLTIISDALVLVAMPFATSSFLLRIDFRIFSRSW